MSHPGGSGGSCQLLGPATLQRVAAAVEQQIRTHGGPAAAASQQTRPRRRQTPQTEHQQHEHGMQPQCHVQQPQQQTEEKREQQPQHRGQEAHQQQQQQEKEEAREQQEWKTHEQQQEEGQQTCDGRRAGSPRHCCSSRCPSPPRQLTQLSPYEILGVRPSASAAEIRAAYRRAALRWHPDKQQQHSRTARTCCCCRCQTYGLPQHSHAEQQQRLLHQRQVDNSQRRSQGEQRHAGHEGEQQRQQQTDGAHDAPSRMPDRQRPDSATAAAAASESLGVSVHPNASSPPGSWHQADACVQAVDDGYTVASSNSCRVSAATPLRGPVFAAPAALAAAPGGAATATSAAGTACAGGATAGARAASSSSSCEECRSCGERCCRGNDGGVSSAAEARTNFLLLRAAFEQLQSREKREEIDQELLRNESRHVTWVRAEELVQVDEDLFCFVCRCGEEIPIDAAELGPPPAGRQFLADPHTAASPSPPSLFRDSEDFSSAAAAATTSSLPATVPVLSCSAGATAARPAATAVSAAAVLAADVAHPAPAVAAVALSSPKAAPAAVLHPSDALAAAAVCDPGAVFPHRHGAANSAEVKAAPYEAAVDSVFPSPSSSSFSPSWSSSASSFSSFSPPRPRCVSSSACVSAASAAAQHRVVEAATCDPSRSSSSGGFSPAASVRTAVCTSEGVIAAAQHPVLVAAAGPGDVAERSERRGSQKDTAGGAAAEGGRAAKAAEADITAKTTEAIEATASATASAEARTATEARATEEASAAAEARGAEEVREKDGGKRKDKVGEIPVRRQLRRRELLWLSCDSCSLDVCVYENV